ncbi:MAG: PEGA domain-containing protein [Bdellovibrionales bacterium]|nr:PEGA domain-containing protein [Bdellovibrionales bacterium]NQZ18392.1 PEGA domain-containing protein [Bdellovibrionales bacterium]
MEILLLALLFFLRTSHIRGFSHQEHKNWNSLYILVDQDDLDVYVDGYPTGLQAPCQLYFEPNKGQATIELKRKGYELFYKNVEFTAPKSFLMGQIERRLYKVPANL